MSRKLQNNLGQFGTTPVFIASISTILGAILFLRFGYAVGNVGFFGAIAIIILGHAVTIPTALAVAEIATNRKVEGGGDYYVISRSFGINIGAAIGVALFLSQAISVSFYVIAFACINDIFGFIDVSYNGIMYILLPIASRCFVFPIVWIVCLIVGVGFAKWIVFVLRKRNGTK